MVSEPKPIVRMTDMFLFLLLGLFVWRLSVVCPVCWLLLIPECTAPTPLFAGCRVADCFRPEIIYKYL